MPARLSPLAQAADVNHWLDHIQIAYPEVSSILYPVTSNPAPCPRKPRPMATRKLYLLLASILKDAHTVQGISPEDVGTIAYALADGLAEDNPRFDREKFLAACEVGDL